MGWLYVYDYICMQSWKIEIRFWIWYFVLKNRIPKSTTEIKIKIEKGGYK